MGGQHIGLFLSGSPPILYIIIFSWQINSAAAAASLTYLYTCRVSNLAHYRIKMAAGSSTNNDQPEEDASELIFPKGNNSL